MNRMSLEAYTNNVMHSLAETETEKKREKIYTHH